MGVPAAMSTLSVFESLTQSQVNGSLMAGILAGAITRPSSRLIHRMCRSWALPGSSKQGRIEEWRLRRWRLTACLYVSGNLGRRVCDGCSKWPLAYAEFIPHSDLVTHDGLGKTSLTMGSLFGMAKSMSSRRIRRLFALDAGTGNVLWKAKTLVKDTPGYECPGAPQVAGAVVVVGNAGGENNKGGVRGHVSAYRLVSGQLAWRTYTVPELGEKDAANT